ncbi:uncharacterized protein LOC123271707 [Cotesia glomerata]|uniref:uncharacterized protein LOC123271707 n=1 Tax=Cotesia glomerata TaxID=32391 RepID=UPI001D01E5F4|nr:uncharacterized protein LOC123271707 [Cotesia glomerata]
MSSSDSSVSNDDENMDIDQEAQAITQELVAKKSTPAYHLCYQNFLKWKTQKNINDISENVLLVYFSELSKTLKPSTLWSRWSMLKTEFNLNHSIDINKFHRLKTFMKNNNKGFRPKKSQVFSLSQIKKFLVDASDDIYLAMKVILIFGFCGALRSGEYCSIKTQDVEDTGTQFIVTIRDTKNYYPRSFVIMNEYSDKVRQYVALRPENSNTDRFFILYDKGACKRQSIGKNTITEIPKKIAEFLKLPNASSYTGHSFRRTSATLLANAGANLTTLKQHGGWRSSSVAEGYIENSLYNKTKIFNHIVNSENTLFTIQNHSMDTTTETSKQDESRPSTSTSSQPPEPLATTKHSCKENIAPQNKHESHQSLTNYQNELRAVNDII